MSKRYKLKMSNSVVKVTDMTDDLLNDNLLMLIGEDGTVVPDRNAVENYLNNKSGPTDIQIMHIKKTDSKDNIDMDLDNVTYLPENIEVVHEEDIVAKEEMDDKSYDLNIVAINLYNVKLDHDYTTLTSPKRESPLPEDDELAKTLSILHGNEHRLKKEPSVVTVPPKTLVLKPNKTINIISSIIIPPKNAPKLIITNPGMVKATPSVPVAEDKKSNKKTEPVKVKGKAKILHTSPKVAKRGRPPKKIPSKIEESSDNEEEDTDEEENEFIEEEEESDEDFNMEMEDDENDSDFDIQEEITGKKSKKFKKRTSVDATKKSNRLSESCKTVKTNKSTPEKLTNNKNENDVTDKTSVAKKENKITEHQVNEEKPTKTEEIPSEVEEKKTEKEETKAEEVKPPEKKPPKKKKEPPKPIPGDFALFSTPDIIRKVGGKEATTPEATLTTSTTPKLVKELKFKSDPPKPAKISQESRSKSTVAESPETPKTSNRLSLDEKHQSKGKERRESIEKHKFFTNKERHSTSRRSSESDKSEKKSSKTSSKSEHFKRDQSPSKHSRHSSDSQEVIPSAEDIRSIIMNEDVKTYTTNTIPIPDSPVQSNDSPALNLDESGLDLDQSILDNINNDMISEDILYQVAKQLVSNTELQNAIDKGINEGVLDTSGIDMTSEVTPDNSANNSILEPDQTNIIKEGKQIIRPDGTILILPPIERPTTRSRNKKKDETPTVTPVKPKPSFKTVHKPLDDEHVSGNELDSSGEEEEESEDDPNKLWCICNQPHNNRFMICCDTCEEWYHGKCVNITKAMGQQMEAEGKEWICLFCKDPALKRPAAAARRIRKASRNSTDSNSSTKKAVEKEKPASMPCVVCQKVARKNSIYCSENCILTHAQGIEKVVVFERSTGNMLTGNKAPSAANLDQWLKDHPGYEVVRSAGKVVTTKIKSGQMTQSKLKLIKNPNNQGVSLAVQQKGVSIGVLKHAPKHPQQTEQKQQQEIKAAKFYKVFQRDPNSKVKLIQPQPMKPKEVATPSPKAKIQVQTLLAPKLPPKTPQPQTPKKEKEVVKQQQQKTPKSKQPKDEAQTPHKREDIRDNVQKTVFEQLTVRLKGSDVKLTEEEIKNISIEIENELYKCFGDTGQKYKNKYRSLIFNIKDPKNQTLWRRICEKSISSYELVRLSPDDMASQELAKWREQEAKHQLDMIKKSEIELLNCNRQYVLKTHKGEEVLEDNRPGITADNTEIIKSLTEGTTLDTGVDPKNKDKDKRSKSNHKDKSKDKDRHLSKDRKEKDEKSNSRKRSKSRSRDKTRSEKKKKRSRSRSKSKERDRSREKNRDRHRKSSYKSSKHKKSPISSTDTLDKRSKEILEQLNRIAPPLEDRLWKHVPQDDIVPDPVSLDSDSDHEIPTSTVTIPTPPRIPEVEDFSSEDSKTSKDVELLEESGLSPPPKSSPAEIWSGTINMVDVAQISITAHEVSGDCVGLNKELSENLDIVGRISPDTVWDYIGKMRSSNSKIISLIRLNATNQEEQMPYLALYSYLSSRNRLGVVKSTIKAIKDFYILPLAAQKPIPQALLPINGPVREWLEESVRKINDRIRNGFEEARPALLLGIIVRDKRKRSIIDPLPAFTTPHKKQKIEVHVQIQPPARSYTPPPMPPEVAPMPPPPLPPLPPIKADSRLLAELPPLVPLFKAVPPPPPQSKNSLSIAKLKMASSEAIVIDDADEPYSPEDSDPDTTITETIPQSSILNTISSDTSTASNYSTIPGLGDGLPATKMDIQRQMEELNKQIEQQKSEITSITKNIATSTDSEIVGSALASIALPSNLQQILDSIKTISGETSSSDTPVQPKEPSTPLPATEPDLTIPLMIPKTFTRPLNETIPLNLPTKSKATTSLEDKSSLSVLSTLTEEDLIKKANEMLNEDMEEKRKPRTPPPPPLVSFSITKKSKLDVTLPPVPGIDD